MIPNLWEKMSVAIAAQTLFEPAGMYCILIRSEVSSLHALTVEHGEAN